MSYFLPLQIFSEKVDELKENKTLPPTIAGSFSKMLEIITREVTFNTQMSNEQLAIICEYFTEEAERLLKAQQSIFNLDYSLKMLDLKLYGVPPLSKKIKAAVCGVIGALVGFILGIIVGTAVTSWGGGFGALPGAILLAGKGFTLGMVVGAGAAGAFSLAGSVGGFFHARSEQKARHAKRFPNNQKTVLDFLQRAKSFRNNSLLPPT